MAYNIRWQLYSILLLNILLKGSSACFSVCTCKWKNGKQTVDCSNTSLTEIPVGMDPETQVLKFSGNNLHSLERELFLKRQIINLQRIYLANCKIKTIHAETFKGLTNLVEIDLSNNLLDSVPTDAFINCPSLMKLALNFNRIKSLQKFAFNHLSYLNSLELSSCEISNIEEGAFQGLHSLEWLNLDGNRLKTIRGRRTLPENIKGVELQKNTWECDCHIHDLYAWLQNFSMSLTAEPVCNGPPRLAGHIIKSIPAAELACLPDISPTAFYLELGEGKNVSLLCHVHAIPEATVSWWFQGQMLQNNTMVAPGVHLIYFVEEGSENKRSELFIYNANADDNGTFICNAENAAGTAQSNFTIKIILKEEPIVDAVKVINSTTTNCNQEELTYNNGGVRAVIGTYACEELFSALSPVGTAANQLGSPSLSLRRYHIEQNPDLINGTESIGCRREGDGQDEHIHEHGTLENQESGGKTLPLACLRRGSREFYKDVHCITMDAEGYPTDYGLPKLACQIQCTNNYYRTLPSSRIKRHSAANPINRFSREAEFLSRSVDSTQYDHFHTDVRYTADGYPVRVSQNSEVLPASFITTTQTILDNQNDIFMGDNNAPSSLPCCSVQWPACVPGNLHVAKSNVEYNNSEEQTKFHGSVLKRCVSAQTDGSAGSVNSDLTEAKFGTNASNFQNNLVNEVLTESPDEGYEGEPSVA